MKTTLILGALALCLAAPAVASADSFVITTHRHHRSHNNDAVIINQDGQRLHYRRHGTEAFYDNGNRNWRRHHRRDHAVIINQDGQRLHHRRHGTEAFYDNGNRNWRRHHRRDHVVVTTGSIERRHHRHVIIQDDNNDY